MKKDPKFFLVKVIFGIGITIVLISMGIMLILTPTPKKRASFFSEIGITADNAHMGGSFELVSSKKVLVNSRDLKGKLLLVYFGFTRCPDICPASLTEISSMLDTLGNLSPSIQPIFISIDPKRDTPEELDVFFKNFDARIIALTGSDAQIANVAKQFKVYYAVAHDGRENTNDYLVNHSSFYYLINQEGKLIKYYSPGTSGKDMAKDIKKLLAAL